MRKKILLTVFLLYVLGIKTNEIHAQNMYVKLKNGTELTKQIASLQKLTFLNNKLVLNYISGSTDTYNISDVGKLYFLQSTVGIDDQMLIENEKIITIYPNPVNNILYLKNITENISEIFIYRMDGAMVLEKHITPENNSIDVSNLSNGIYLIRVNNKTLKFNKL